jgi:hypothetical protein
MYLSTSAFAVCAEHAPLYPPEEHAHDWITSPQTVSEYPQGMLLQLGKVQASHCPLEHAVPAEQVPQLTELPQPLEAVPQVTP